MDQSLSVPRAEYEALRAAKDSLQAANASLQARLAALEAQLAWLRRQVFGPKSERLVDLPGSLPLLPGLEQLPPPDPPPPAPPSAAPAAPRRTKRQGSGGLVIPAELERVEVLLDVPLGERTLPDGSPLVKIGEDRSEKLAFRPGEYYVKVFVRPRYAAPGQPGLGVVQEAMPPTLLEGSKFDASLLAHLVVEKFQFHLPLYRLQEKFAGRDIQVGRQTLAAALKTCGERVKPLVDRMREKLLNDGCLCVDETPVKVQAPGKCREARVWLYLNAKPGAPPWHLYQFTPDRGHRHPLAYLKDFRGTLHADAFGAYEELDRNPDLPIRWAACWAHARRKFEQAQSGDPELRLWVLRQIRYLFLYERVAWARGPDERIQLRAEKETPLVDRLFARLKTVVAEGRLLPQSQLAQAIGYLLSRPENFRLYLSDPDLRMDNNPAERGLRKLVLGRKNWLFFGSDKAGESMANLLSLVQTCRALEIDPQRYLEDLFNRLLDHPAKHLDDLLPDRWLAQRQAPQPAN